MVKRDIEDPLFDEVSRDRLGMAFPHEWVNAAGVPMGYHGMTLRDYFAAKAMQALIRDEYDMESMARDAYHYADAMLKQRAKL